MRTIVLLLMILTIGSCQDPRMNLLLQRDFQENPIVIIRTSKGDIEVELFPKKAPASVANFMGYVEEEFYDGLVFHRIIPDFMIQGGGFDENLQKKKPANPIKNEANNGLKNNRGTIAMARTSQINSATSQFYINLKDNESLNHSSKDFGYAVFGKVIKGMDIVDKISLVSTSTKPSQGMMLENVPTTPVKILSIREKDDNGE